MPIGEELIDTGKDIISSVQDKYISTKENILTNPKISKGYLMVGGTFLTATAMSLIVDAIGKPQYKNIAVLGGLILGGFITAKMLKQYE